METESSKKYPIILLLCHNIYENNNNIGKTLISLLGNWPKDKICQIYLRDDIPTFNYCYNYYRILDKDIIKSYFKGKNVVGTAFKKEDSNSDNLEENNKNGQTLYNIGNKRIPIVSMARDLLWKNKSWKNTRLNTWLAEQRPDLILFVPNDYELIYPIANYISKYMDIPIIPYYMDDAFYFDMFVSPIDAIRRWCIRKKGRKLLADIPTIITIGPKMSTVYERKFKKNCTELMNSVNVNYEDKPATNKNIVMSYVGNLHSNRWKSIVEIGKAIDQVNEKVDFSIYSASFMTKRMIKAFGKIKCLNFRGKILPEQVDGVLQTSNVLLFVESFNKKSKASTKYSLSTKIPEYLNSYRCIFAYGPSDISSIEYLRDNNLAIICNSKKDIKVSLEKAFTSLDSIDYKYISNFVFENHNIEKNREKIEKIIFDRMNNK